MSDLETQLVVHIHFDAENPAELVEQMYDRVTDLVYGDPELSSFISSHGQECDVSSHCYGPGSKAAIKYHDEAIDEALSALVERVREKSYAGKHLNWLDIVSLLNTLRKSKDAH